MNTCSVHFDDTGSLHTTPRADLATTTRPRVFARVGLVVLSLLTIVAADTLANDWDSENDPVELSALVREGWAFSEPVTVEEVERRSLDVLSKGNGHAPLVPFGGRNAAWEAFKTAMRPGDVIVFFRSPSDSWDALYGRSGYALVRDGMVVCAILTLVN